MNKNILLLIALSQIIIIPLTFVLGYMLQSINIMFVVVLLVCLFIYCLFNYFIESAESPSYKPKRI